MASAFVNRRRGESEEKIGLKPQPRDAWFFAFGACLAAVVLTCVHFARRSPHHATYVRHCPEQEEVLPSGGAVLLPPSEEHEDMFAPLRPDALVLEPKRGVSPLRRELVTVVAPEHTLQYAYVHLAYDPPGEPPKQFRRALALAQNLQRVRSQHPLLVLTNSTALSDGAHMSSRLRKLNVRVLPVHALNVPRTLSEKLSPAQLVDYWGLQLWSLTQFKKLVWLRDPAMVVRNIDWLFDRTSVWGQRDDTGDCGLLATVGASDAGTLGSAVLLLEPDSALAFGIEHYGTTLALDWWRHGVERLIANYFKYVGHWSVQYLEPWEASGSACLGVIPNVIPLGPEVPKGPWQMPSVVDVSADHHVCFDFNLTAQLALDEGRSNLCHRHPLSAPWRDDFCSAMNLTAMHDDLAKEFCRDSRWYNVTRTSPDG